MGGCCQTSNFDEHGVSKDNFLSTPRSETVPYLEIGSPANQAKNVKIIKG